MWRQAAFDDEGMEGPRPRAMVMGGWSTNLEEDEVLQLARKFGEEVGLDLDLAEAFMPGRQKGILIVPLAPRRGEDRAKLQRPRGNPAKVWLAISESPEQRRRTKQMSKTKRTVLEIAEKTGKSSDGQGGVQTRTAVDGPPQDSGHRPAPGWDWSGHIGTWMAGCAGRGRGQEAV